MRRSLSGRGFVDFFLIVTYRNTDRMQLYKYRFLCATDMTSHRTLEEKLRWNFKAYDNDRSGTLEKEELVFFMALVFQSKVRFKIIQIGPSFY